MKNGEFYQSNEYNAISEYQHFPAEMYIRPKEENACGNEKAELGKEITALQPKQPTPKSGGAKNLIDRIFGSIRGVATAATVAVASLVVTTTFVTDAPQAELVDLVCGDTYVEYQMEVSGLQEDSAYAIVVSTSNEEDIEVELEGDGTYQKRIEGLKPDWEYTLSLVCYDTALGEVSYLDVKFQTLKHSEQQPLPPPEPPPAPQPQAEVTDILVVGLNEVRIYFTCRDLPANSRVELDVLSGGLGTQKIVATEGDLARGYVTAAVDGSATLTVTPCVVVQEGGGEVITVCAAYGRTFEQTFSVQTMIGLYNGMITFYPTGLTNGAEYICVTSSEAPGTTELLYIEGVVRTWYTTTGEITYTLYLADGSGNALSDEVTVTVDTSVVPPSLWYDLSYPNPGDAGVTYNDDGTVNLYFDMQFEADSEEIYYQVTVEDKRYVSRDKVLRIENLPDESYALQYDVCVDIDGVQYSIFHVTPSGMLNEPYVLCDATLTGDTLALQLYKDAMYLDLSKVVLIGAGGEEIVLTEADLHYNTEYGVYEATVQFSRAVEHVTVRMLGNPYHKGLTDIEDLAGSVRKWLEVTVY